MSTPAIEVNDLSVAYGTGPNVLEGVGLRVRAGTMVGIVGPNGGGKSTLLKAILGLLPRQGEVSILGRGVGRRARRQVGYVPQRDDVDWSFPVNVFDVALMGRTTSMTPFRRVTKCDRELVWEALRTVGMAEHARARIGALSGGQQQRVFLARALAQQAEVLLLDEPISGVDAPSQYEVFELLRRLREMGKTILVTSHDLQFVGEHFDLALLLNGGVVAFGPPREVFVPRLLRRTYESHLMVFPDTDGVVVPGEAGDRGRVPS